MCAGWCRAYAKESWAGILSHERNRRKYSFRQSAEEISTASAGSAMWHEGWCGAVWCKILHVLTFIVSYTCQQKLHNHNLPRKYSKAFCYTPRSKERIIHYGYTLYIEAFEAPIASEIYLHLITNKLSQLENFFWNPLKGRPRTNVITSSDGRASVKVWSAEIPSRVTDSVAATI